MSVKDLSCEASDRLGRISPMPKPRDKVTLYMTPADRAALDALLEAIQPGLKDEHGEESNAVMRMFRLGMEAFAGSPSSRHALPPHPGRLVKLVLEAKARDVAAGPGARPEVIEPSEPKKKKA